MPTPKTVPVAAVVKMVTERARVFRERSDRCAASGLVVEALHNGCIAAELEQIIRSVAARAGRKTTTRIEITRASALKLGIVRCRCGHPPNNHFQHGSKSCAHCECKKYREEIHAP